MTRAALVNNVLDIEPPCPFCGECQSRDAAIPSKPRVMTYTDYRRGRFVEVRDTVYDTHCRHCGERMMWGFTYGAGTLEEIATGDVHYHWSAP